MLIHATYLDMFTVWSQDERHRGLSTAAHMAVLPRARTAPPPTSVRRRLLYIEAPRSGGEYTDASSKIQDKCVE